MIGQLWTYSHKYRDRQRTRRNAQSRTWTWDPVSCILYVPRFLLLNVSPSGYGCLDHFLEGEYYSNLSSFTVTGIDYCYRGYRSTLLGSTRQDPFLRCDYGHRLRYWHVSIILLFYYDLSKIFEHTGPSCTRMWSTIVVSSFTTNKYSSFAQKCGWRMMGITASYGSSPLGLNISNGKIISCLESFKRLQSR